MSLSGNEVVLRTARDYNRNAASWSASSEDRAAWKPSYDAFASLLPPGFVVLDLGCGSGLDAPGLAERGLQLVGLDISAELLRLASQRLVLRGRLLRGDLRRLPFAAGSFDALWLDGSLHHIRKSDVPLALEDCARVLRPGGIFFASVERGQGEGFAVQDSTTFDAPRWYALYELAELRSLLAEAGLAVVDAIVAEPSETSDNGFVAVFARRGT